MSNTCIEQLIKKLLALLDDAKNPSDVIAIADKVIAAIDRQDERDIEGLWDIDTAARYLGIKRDTLRKWCSERRIPHITIGDLKRFDSVSLRKWALAREVKTHKAWR